MTEANRNDADLVIHARWVVPIEPEGTVLDDHAVAIKAGKILDLVPSEAATARFAGAPRVDLPDHVVIPGLVNAHTHAAMSMFKGMADDLPLMTWLNEHIWPAEAKWVASGFVRDGTRLAAAEMLLGGTTCFNDMYFYPNDAALAARELGMRAMAGLIVVDFPTVWAGSPDEYLAKAIAVHDELRDLDRVYTAFAPHAPYTVSDGPLERIRTLADELDIPVHIHLHETAHEVEQAVEHGGERPLARLARLGLVSDRLLAVHMTTLTPDEVEAVAHAGAHVIHCPESNMKLASGACPVAALLKAGANVALGTDGAASNNDLSMLGEARTASLLAKLTTGDASVLPAAQCLSLATIAGARALGLDQDIGSLRPGKAADLVAVDLGGIENQPVYDPISHLVYCANASHVRHVWVDGRQVVADRNLTETDMSEIRETAQQWRSRICSEDEPST